MPFSSSTYDHFIGTMVGLLQPSTACDIGPGAGKYGRLIKKKAMDEGFVSSVTAVEIDESYVLRYKLDAIYDKVIVDDAVNLIGNPSVRFDLVMIGDCIEHMRKSAGVDLLNFLIYRSGYICIVYPEAYVQDDWEGHAAEAHISTWSADDFTGWTTIHHIQQNMHLFLIKGFQPSRLVISTVAREEGEVLNLGQNDAVGITAQFAHMAGTRDWDAAVGLALRHFEIVREVPDLFVRIATLLLDAKMIDAAEAYLRQGCIRWPDEVWLPWHHARLANNHRDFQVAAARWEDLIARHPESPLGLCGLAELHRNSGRETDAARLYAEATIRYPDYVWAAAGHANTAALSRDWPEAARRWTDIRDRFPELLHAHDRLVHALIEEGRLAEAGEAVRRGLIAFPQAENLAAASVRIAERIGKPHRPSEDPLTAGSDASTGPSAVLNGSGTPSRHVPPLPARIGKGEALRLLAEAHAVSPGRLSGERISDILESALRLGGPSNEVKVNLIPAAEAQGQQKTVFEASVQRLEAPTHLTGRPDCFPPVGGENAYSPELKVMTLPRGVYCNFAESSVVFSEDGMSIVREYSSKYSRLVQFYDIDLEALIKDAMYLDGIAIVLPDDIRPLNFSHWLVDWLPRLAFLGPRVRRSEYYVLTPPLTAPYQLDTLLMCGFDRDRVIQVQNFQAIRARELLVTSDMRDTPHPAFKAAPWAVSYIQSTVGVRSLLACRSASSEFPKKLYISRADAVGRRVANEDELLAMLAKAGYVKIVLSKLTMREQVALFVGATHVVGIHGAGFGHLVFPAEPATVIEIFPATHGTPAFYILTAGLENRYATYLATEVVATGGTTILSDYDVIINVADFERRCAHML